MGPDTKGDSELTQAASAAGLETRPDVQVELQGADAESAQVDTALAPDLAIPRSEIEWPSIECAQARFQAFAEANEFPYFKVSLDIRKQENHFIRAEITNYPLTWLKRYRRCGYAKVDPEPSMVREAWSPFAWDELKARAPAARRLFEDAAVHGLVDGFTVPLYCSNGESAALTLAGPRMPKRPEARWGLYFGAYRFQCVAFSRLRTLLQTAPSPPSRDRLTDRQRHILFLLMQGMGVKSIARHLGLHTRTIDDGLRRACQRLGVTSREQAIVRALATRQIDASSLVQEAAADVVYYVPSHTDPHSPP
ncbi:MAG: LuxR family transcriptional regulator [Gammaproteobacteria bacterium]